VPDEIAALLERQARWQRSRKDLSWPEKLRLAAAVRESVVRLRLTARESQNGERKEPEPARR
jgi:hypothetical protein